MKTFLPAMFLASSLALTAFSRSVVLDEAKSAYYASQYNDLVIKARTIAAGQTSDAHDKIMAGDKKLENKFEDDLRRFMMDEDVSFIYTLGVRGNQLVFVLNSEDDTDPSAVRHGQLYHADNRAARVALGQQVAAISQQPYMDGTGTVYSAYAPITNGTSEHSYAVGIDVRRESFEQGFDRVEDSINRATFLTTVGSVMVAAAYRWLLSLAEAIVDTAAKSRAKLLQRRRDDRP